VTVSRARGKLEAALARFGLAARLRGANAVDVGASTGGFTEALLAHGAARVTAVDVGHGQLHPSLRGDPRVSSLEGVDWRRLSLGEAEGPFDFFTVDVSFVAARNMLRGLAFRLRDGAEGVVLVKPQFELPDSARRAPGADEARLRATAVEKLRRRAETLGFALLAQADSPVPGGSGTIEVLAHLRFAGRPATMPRPGERRPKPPAAATAARPAPRAPASGQLRWFAVVAPGLEEVAAREVTALPDAAAVAVVPGGVEWSGPPASGLRANLWLRIATRVLARAGEVKAREFGPLRRHAARLPWGAFVAPGATISVRASAARCRLYHTGALSESVALAVTDAVPGARATTERKEADVEILVRGVEDRFTFSVDASGDRLHLRGARVETGAAPLRETLAAGLLALAGWTPDTPLVDPMCGAGTILIEAWMQARGLPPGGERSFALEAWPLCAGAEVAARLGALRAEARDRAPAPQAAPHAVPILVPHLVPILGADRDPRAIETARRNLARAGAEHDVTLACQDASALRPPAPTGLVVANPPYGRRLGDPRAAARGYRDLGRVLRAQFRGWQAAILVPARFDPGKTLGLRLRERIPLRNGGLAVTLALCTVE
jgi:putative N6-adenine-specific DNA methylase